MSKILMLASIFPIPDVKMLNSTSVCHYFAKEWIKKGHEVVVIYNYTIYTPILHWIAKKFESKIASYAATVINKNRFNHPMTYEMDGVKVLLAPCYKFIPKKSFPKSSIQKQAILIKNYTHSIQFAPDVVVGHFLHPSLEILSLLKCVYKVKTALILHGKILSQKDIQSIEKYKRFIDQWGFRSNPIKKSFSEKWSSESDSGFMCYSGVPAEYISDDAYYKMEKQLNKFVYVGNLISRKHPLVVAEALNRVYGNNLYSLVYVGSGVEEKSIHSYINKYSIGHNISLIGRQNRDEVRLRMLSAECFIMISENETFGLVYLEAMANGCITIASKNEGMEGIIIDGYNGFLCKAGDVNSLAAKIEHIRSLSKEDRIFISKNAIETAKKMTDEMSAVKYIDSLLC